MGFLTVLLRKTCHYHHKHCMPPPALEVIGQIQGQGALLSFSSRYYVKYLSEFNFYLHTPIPILNIKYSTSTHCNHYWQHHHTPHAPLLSISLSSEKLGLKGNNTVLLFPVNYSIHVKWIAHKCFSSLSFSAELIILTYYAFRLCSKNAMPELSHFAYGLDVDPSCHHV